MSYQFYTVLHLIGIFLVLVSLGGICLHMLSGGTRDYPFRKWVGAWHGVGLLITLIAGFGLAAKLGIGRGGLPFWIIVKLCVWLILGGLPALLYRKPKLAKLNWFLIVALAVLAAAMAIYKPMPF